MKRKRLLPDETEQTGSGWSSDANGDLGPGKKSKPQRRRFDHDASIVFVGLRATGNSSLAFIAASVLGWKLIDCDRHFDEYAGLTKEQYRAEHGAEQYRMKKLGIVHQLLKNNRTRSVIACGNIVSRNGAEFLSEFTDSLPIIYVMREEELVRQCLGLTGDQSWFRALDQAHHFFRRCSNFEFFNLDEAQEPLWQSKLTQFLAEKSHSESQVTAAPILRRTQRHVATLLQNVYGPAFKSNYHGDTQLTRTSPELRQGSFILRIKVEGLQSEASFWDSLNTDCDAVQLDVSSTPENWPLLLKSYNLAWPTAILRRKLDVPIAINISSDSSSDDPQSGPDLKLYRQLLHHALRVAPEFLIIDLRTEDELIREVVQCKAFTKIIGALQISEDDEEPWNVTELVQAYQRASELGCDIVSFLGSADSIEDNLKCQQAAKLIACLGKSAPAVLINTGTHGRLSQVLNKAMTPVVQATQAPFVTSARDAVQGLTTPQCLRSIRHMLSPNLRSQFYVVGAEVKESLSPALHNAGFQSCGVPYSYGTHQTGEMASLKELVLQSSFGGASIAFPFKPLVLSLASRHSPAVVLIGAANTLLYTDNESAESHDSSVSNGTDGRVQLVAENTDWVGIYVCVAKHTTPANNITKDTSALVLGAGGIARAAVYALMQLGVGHISILNRTNANAEKVTKHFETVYKNTEVSISDTSADSRSATTVPRFHVLRHWNEPWPADVPLPRIVICTIPAQSTTKAAEYPPELRSDWFGNTTGGLIADVSSHNASEAVLINIAAFLEAPRNEAGRAVVQANDPRLELYRPD